MQLRNLNTFVKVAQLGGFHAAAQQLHATQPTVSARIQALENELNVKLFQRDKSGTRLTARGQQLLPYAEKLLAISQEMKEQLQTETPEKGILRIGIADTLAYLWLTPLVKAWREEYPLISFEMTSDLSSSLVEQLQNHQLDLAFMVAPTQQLPELVIEPLCSYEQIWVAAPSLVGAISDPNLDQYPILSFPRGTRPWLLMQQLISDLPNDVVVHTCSSVASLLSLAIQGLGLALLPRALVSDALQQKQLIEIDISASGDQALDFCCAWRLDDDRVLPRLLSESGRIMMMRQ